MHTIEKLISCARPIWLESDVEDYEYSCAGTAFLCSVDGATFIVTAKHCMEAFPLDALRVYPSIEDRNSVPYKLCATPTAGAQDDAAFMDLALYLVDMNEYDQQRLACCNPVELTDQNVKGKPPAGGKIIVRGFLNSTVLPKVDYEKLKLLEQGTSFSGVWDRVSPKPYCQEAQLDDVSGCETLDGMSGSPVFWISSEGEPREWRFCGVLICASHELRQVLYVDGAVLLQAARQMIADE